MTASLHLSQAMKRWQFLVSSKWECCRCGFVFFGSCNGNLHEIQMGCIDSKLLWLKYSQKDYAREFHHLLPPRAKSVLEYQKFDNMHPNLHIYAARTWITVQYHVEMNDHFRYNLFRLFRFFAFGVVILKLTSLSFSSLHLTSTQLIFHLI